MKALPKEVKYFKYLCRKFLALSTAEIKDGVFTGPDVRKLLKDDNFEKQVGDAAKEVWGAFNSLSTAL